MNTNGSVSHNWNEETIEAKTLWFSSLTIEERMDLFCSITDLALSADPSLPERHCAEPIAGRIQVISAP